MNGTGLVADIREAFRGVKLEDGESLNMTEYHDSGGSAKHFEAGLRNSGTVAAAPTTNTGETSAPCTN
jgi:hypothetical protein